MSAGLFLRCFARCFGRLDVGGRRLGRLARGRRPLRVHELVDALADHVRRRLEVDVVGRVDDAEADLADRVARREQDGLGELEDLLRRVERLVAVEVAPEHPRELLQVADRDAAPHQLLRPLRVAHLAQEVLLARGADEVVVAVAVADVGQRVGAAELLVARVDVDHRVAAGAALVVEVVAVDVGVDAADVVDRAPEAAEVDRDHVVDRERLAVDLEQVLDRADRAALAGGLVRGVDLDLVADARDVDEQVARDRHHRDDLLVRVEPDEDHRVRARLVAGLAVAVADVGAEDHQRLRLAGVGAVDLGDLDRRPPLGAQDVEHVVDLQQHGRGDRARGREADQHAGEQRAQHEPAADARRRGLVVVRHDRVRRVAHASPPSTTLSPSGRPSADGRPSTKSRSAWR